MLDVLGRILCAIKNLPWYFLDVIVAALNGLVLAIGTAAAALLSLFPDMPNMPDTSVFSTGALGIINYFVPTSQILALMVFFVGAWLTVLGLRVIGNWLKVL